MALNGWVSVEAAIEVLGEDVELADFLRNAETLSDKRADDVLVARESVWQYIAYASFDENGRPCWPD